MNEGLEDGPGESAWFAQTSGIVPAVDGSGQPDGHLWIADSETSSLRRVELSDGADSEPAATVSTAVGQGLFDFGHRDGAADQALLQHPLGVAVLPDGSVVVADTYNGAVRRYDPASGEVTTLATDLAEPSDVLVEVADDAVHLLVVESAAHRLTRVALPSSLAGEVLDGGAHRVARPATDVGGGPLRLEVPFVPAPGQKLDERWGPSTTLQVSATPPELLLSGAGNGTDLFRDLVVNPDVTEGVLHVTAKAASCDEVPLLPNGEPDPDVFPACHLAQQDWGVPVRVVPAGDAELTLPLRG
jgi:hypothetical protein